MDFIWIYRFAFNEGCPPWWHGHWDPDSPFDRVYSWLEEGGPYPIQEILLKYEWRELGTLIGMLPLLSIVIFFAVRSLVVVRCSITLRTLLVVVALVAVEWKGLGEIKRRIDAWEDTWACKGQTCCIDTWIWGDEDDCLVGDQWRF